MGELREYIEGIRFDSKWGRYDARQVDAFLEELLTRVDALSAELAAAKEKNAMFEKQSASMAAAMITAEKNCAVMLDDAKAEAEKIKAAAKQEGDDYVRSMYDRQSDMENEYREKKDALAAELAQLKSFKEKYHHAIERDAVELLSKTTGLDSNKVWREMPEELRREYGLDDTYEGLDLNEILKDLPETDHDLKAMIEGLL